MTEGEWLTNADPEPMLNALGSKPSRRKFGLYACACCRLVFDWLVDNRSREAVGVLEAYADGSATEADLQRARGRASRAAGVVGGPPAWAVVSAAHDRPDSFCCRDVTDDVGRSFGDRDTAEWVETRSYQAELLKDVFGNPFRAVAIDRAWLTSTVLALARQMYESRDVSAMPILADALQDAGCDNDDILSHCRGPGPHVRGCWVVDLVLGKE